MQHWMDKLIDIAAMRGDKRILENALENLAEKAGFRGYAYMYIRPGHTISLSNYHPKWREEYSRRNLSDIDPVVRRAKSFKRAFSWSGDDDRLYSSRTDRALFVQSANFGIRSGITIPIKTANGSMSMFTLASENGSLDLERDIDPVAAAAAVGQLHALLSVLPARPTDQNPTWLDPKEAAYLNWIAVGKTMHEAADLEGVKYNSVKSKIEETRKRLDVHTMPHLVAIAIRAGLI